MARRVAIGKQNFEDLILHQMQTMHSRSGFTMDLCWGFWWSWTVIMQ